MSHKRKKGVVSVEQELQAIQILDDGEILSIVTADYGVEPNTVGDWRRNRTNLERKCISNKRRIPKMAAGLRKIKPIPIDSAHQDD